MCYTNSTSGDEFVRMRIRCSLHPVRACDALTCTSPGGFSVPLRELQTLNSVPDIYFPKFTVWLPPRDLTHRYLYLFHKIC